MKISEANKNNCMLFNTNLCGYLIVELGSIKHLEAVKKGYKYRGPSYVANITQIDEMSKANEIFMQTLTKK